MVTRTAEQRRIPGEERRVLIVRAAGRAFARDGYAGARIEDIAAAAHVTKPIVYRHFPSKKALYMALLEKHEADLQGFIEAVDPDGLALDQLVRALLEHWFDYVRENQHAWFMPFRDRSGDEEIQALRQRVNLRAREVIAAFLRERANGRPTRSSRRPRRSRTASPASRCGGSTIRRCRRRCRSTSGRGL